MRGTARSAKKVRIRYLGHLIGAPRAASYRTPPGVSFKLSYRLSPG